MEKEWGTGELRMCMCLQHRFREQVAEMAMKGVRESEREGAEGVSVALCRASVKVCVCEQMGLQPTRRADSFLC